MGGELDVCYVRKGISWCKRLNGGGKEVIGVVGVLVVWLLVMVDIS